MSVHQEKVNLSKDQVGELYHASREAEGFGDVSDYLTGGTALMMVLEGPGAVDRWKLLCGPADVARAKACAPTTIRGSFGASAVRDAVHGSRDASAAAVEIAALFFEEAGQRLHD